MGNVICFADQVRIFFLITSNNIYPHKVSGTDDNSENAKEDISNESISSCAVKFNASNVSLDQCWTASVWDEYQTADNSSLYHIVCIFMSGDVNAKYFPNWLHMLLLNTKKMAQTA